MLSKIINKFSNVRNLRPSFRGTFNLWFAYGTINFCGIGLANTFTRLSEIYKEISSHSRNDSVFVIHKKVISSSFGSLVEIFFKSSFYFLAGPVGTYRIGLGLWNFARTLDDGYVHPIICFGPDKRIYRDNIHKYYMKPTGSCSWLPIIRTQKSSQM